MWPSLSIVQFFDPPIWGTEKDTSLPLSTPSALVVYDQVPNVSTNQTVAQNEVPEVDNFIFVCYISVFSCLKCHLQSSRI